MIELPTIGWIALMVGAAVIGLSKAAIPGGTMIAVALFAAVLPARGSTGAVLLLLIVGDAFALWAYRHHADLKVLVRLIPAVLAGLVVGGLFLFVASDLLVRRAIGILLLIVVAVTLWRRRRSAVRRAVERVPHSGRIAAAVYGTLGGFTTMVANAAGPVMSMYFLSIGFPVKTFLGTAAWFFAVVNVGKLPLLASIGIVTADTVVLAALLAPVVIAAAFGGRVIAGRMNQMVFERIVTVTTVAAASYLVVAP